MTRVRRTRKHGGNQLTMIEYNKDLLQSISNGDVEGAKRAIEMGANVNILNMGELIYKFHYKKDYPMEDIISMLLEKRIMFSKYAEAPLIRGLTPIHIAVELNLINIVKLFIERFGAFILNAKDIHGKNVMYHALDSVYFYRCDEIISMLRFLTQYDVQINNFDYDGMTILSKAITHHCADKIIPILIENGADVNFAVPPYHITPLMYVCIIQYNGLTDKIISILINAGANVNATNNIGKTALHFAASTRSHSRVEILLKNGADKSIIDNHGYTALDYARESGNQSVIKLLDDNPNNEEENTSFKIFWTGFSQGDIDFTNMIFDEKIHDTSLVLRTNDGKESLYSICPVCLKHVEHDQKTCMYMTHSCLEDAEYKGYYHKKLWKAFSYAKMYNMRGEIIPAEKRKTVVEWCTLCGRICKDHRHYALGPLYNPDGTIHIPNLLPQGNVFATTCVGSGGGGKEEKLIRYRRFREFVLYLNDPKFIGAYKMTYEDAINQLVEAVWNAPNDPEHRKKAKLIKNSEFNEAVGMAKYPLPSELPTPPEYVYADPKYPDAANPELMPIVYPKAEGPFKNSAYNTFADDDNIVQFRHRMKDGRINKHEGPNQQIALSRLIGYLGSLAVNSPDFGMCWQHSHDNITTINDKANPPLKCTAKLYPEEVLYAIQHATLNEDEKSTYMDAYTNYSSKFLQKFAIPTGLHPNVPPPNVPPPNVPPPNVPPPNVPPPNVPPRNVPAVTMRKCKGKGCTVMGGTRRRKNRK